MKPHQLSPLVPAAIVDRWRKTYSRTTTYKRCVPLRRLLDFIGHTARLQGLRAWVPKVPAPLPRTVIATADQLERILGRAEPWFRCYLLLCTDLALRSGTASRVAPQHYFPEEHVIRVDTKGGMTIELPVSPAIAALFEAAPAGDPTTPYWKLLKGHRAGGKAHGYATLDKRWQRLKRELSLPAELHFHDLRRTAAVRLMDTTNDIRAVSHALGHQSMNSTIIYLAHRDTNKLRAQLQQHWWTPKGQVH